MMVLFCFPSCFHKSSSPEYSEHELEMQLVNNIRAFLIEMGGDYTFIGNQYHLMAGSRDLYIDLLLFHRRLRSLIAIELKIGEFEAEYAGKMQLYLTTLDEQVKLPDENPSIGIIICKSKDKTYVEYALKNINAPIGVATYQLRNTLPEEMKAMLPEPEEIVKRLRIFEEFTVETLPAVCGDLRRKILKFMGKYAELDAEGCFVPANCGYPKIYYGEHLRYSG